MYARFVNPVMLYGLPFALCAFLATTGLFGIYRPAESTLVVIAVSIAGFTIGAIAPRELFRSKRRDKKLEERKGYSYVVTNVNRTMVVLCTIATLISILYLSRTIPLLLSGQGLEDIKFQYSNAQGATLFSTRELLLFQWVVVPIYNLAFIVFAYGLSRMVLNYGALLFSIVGMAVIVLVSGGRNSVFVFLVICVMGLLCSDDRKSIWKIIKSLPPAMKVSAVVAILVLVYITQERSLSEDAGIVENVYFYFAGAIRYLDYILANPALFSIGDDLFYGRALLGFVLNPIDLVSSIVFGYDYQGTDSLVSTSAALYIPFSDDLSGNALCTCIYPFIRDFGSIGVFVGPALYGVISCFVWEKAFSETDGDSPIWKCIWIYLAYCLVFSEWRYTLIFPATGFTFLLVAITFRNVERRSVPHVAVRRSVNRG